MHLDQITAAQAREWAGYLWQLLMVIWVVLWFGMKNGQEAGRVGRASEHGLLVILGFWLLFGGLKDWGWLNDRLLPNLPSMWVTGLLLTAIGVALSTWARLSLGSNWSGMVTSRTTTN